MSLTIFCTIYRDMAGGSMPALYIPHGGGPLPLLGDTSHAGLTEWLKKTGDSLPKPKSILVISAHWEESVATLTTAESPSLLFDYYGFPEKSYKYKYPAPGLPALAKEVVKRLNTAGVPCEENAKRGLDHGVFVPFMLLYPKADIPIVQLSLVKGLDPLLHINIGRVISSLRDNGVLICGSGMSYHNMAAFGLGNAESDSIQFDEYLVDVCSNPKYDVEKREKLLVDWKTAPKALRCHPRAEHLLPLMVVVGAGGNVPATHCFSGNILGARVSAFTFD